MSDKFLERFDWQVWLHYFPEASPTELQEAHKQTLDRIDKFTRYQVVKALIEDDNPFPLCNALKEYGPIQLSDPHVLECVRLLWATATALEHPQGWSKQTLQRI